MDLEVDLAGIKLEHPVMNAAGTCKRLEGEEGVQGLARSLTSAIMLGSITIEAKPGNTGNVWYPSDHFSLNSLGLPNPGSEYLRANLPEMVKVAHGAGKPLFVSIAGFSPPEYVTLAAIAVEGGADLVEFNFGCPNVWGEDGSQKPIASFRPDLIEETLSLSEKEIGQEARAAVKVSPFSDPTLLLQVAEVIGRSALVKVLTTTNTFPNGFSFGKDGNPAITPAEGLAGVGGPGMKPIGLGQVRQFRKLLPERIDIIGAGGVGSGQDVIDYRRAGAKAVALATTFLVRGKIIFSSILDDLLAV